MLIEELTLRGLLSFGPDTEPIPLQSLNLLIGPNGSGKSNLLEAIGLLRSSASKLTGPLRGAGGGGVTEWLWKGAKNGSAKIDAVINYPDGTQQLRHRLEFIESGSRLELCDEAIENRDPEPGHNDAFFYYRYQHGKPALAVKGEGRSRPLRREDVAPDESILSQRKDPDQYPELAYLSDMYGQVRLYREWSFGRSSVFRSPQAADLPSDRLEEDFSNLGLFLNHLRTTKAKKGIIEHLRDLYEGLDEFDVRIKGGTVEVFLTEGDFVIPASRLSDGTLRYLCLLSILCDPDPPALLCIEEPELGLHPDMLPKLADLMAEASQRTQLIVTTHSDALVDAMTSRPEAVVVMEKHNGQTQAKRLANDAELQEWLKKYRLGQLWTRGEIGGVRW
ncbi:MAG: AAA family ATPase [Phycisphaerales bacterium]|nr:AAA family ATPase [Phycisphaerales bacterium]